MPIENLGPYKIERLLGQGGMGAVYLGVNEQTGQKAALKTLSPTLGSDVGFRERFAGEIESLKKLRHPNIVALFAWGEQDRQLFYVMEFVDGASLQDQLQAGRKFDWRETTRIAIDVCRALKHAHDSGVIHRDLKPANLLIDETDRVKLTDFGIAKLFGYSQLTAEGGVLGTADYMAPEQALGQPVTHRCDLYSLGTVMYTLLAGRPPFCAKSLPEVVHKVAFETPEPLRRYAKDVPAELEQIIADLLEKDPAKRVPTAVALLKRLEATHLGLSLDKPRAAGQTAVAPVPVEESDGFDLVDPANPASGSPQVHSATTRYAPAQPSAVSSAPAASIAGELAGMVTEAPVRTRSPEGALASPSLPQSLPNKPARFVTVEEEAELRRQQSEQEEASSFGPLWLRIALVVVGIFAVAFVGWQVTRPPQADDLYRAIVAAAETNDYDALALTQEQMRQFLDRYPSDARAGEVREIQNELELARLQRNFERRSRLSTSTTRLTPVERAYLEAVETGRSRPEEAVAHLQAIINVYGGDKEAERSTEQVVALAQQQLARLRESIARTSEQHLSELAARLAAADKIAATNPNAARNIYAGIITLYSDKPWAAPVVAEAKSKLASLTME